MKRTILATTFVLAVAVSALSFASSQTRAVEVVTDTQIASVKSRCTELQATLNRLEANDKLLRHNIGSTFLVISEKLMVPLNQRIAANQLDGSELLAVTASYTRAYNSGVESDFYASYARYENSLLAAIRTDCVKQPTTFLDVLDQARKDRLQLRSATEQLMKLAQDYKTAFDTFREAQITKKNASEE